MENGTDEDKSVPDSVLKGKGAPGIEYYSKSITHTPHDYPDERFHGYGFKKRFCSKDCHPSHYQIKPQRESFIAVNIENFHIDSKNCH
jgi:hypothetical protein